MDVRHGLRMGEPVPQTPEQCVEATHVLGHGRHRHTILAGVAGERAFPYHRFGETLVHQPEQTVVASQMRRKLGLDPRIASLKRFHLLANLTD